MFLLSKRKHKHNFCILKATSNTIQLDEMGYPLMLCLFGCSCGQTEMQWVDVSEKVLSDTEIQRIKWKDVK